MTRRPRRPLRAAQCALACLVACATLAACAGRSSEGGDFVRRIFSVDTYTPYRIVVQQGQRINAKSLRQLRPGLTRAQVRFLLGDPPMHGLFHLDRWDYVYYARRDARDNVDTPISLTLFFDGDRLARIVDRAPKPRRRARRRAPEEQAQER